VGEETLSLDAATSLSLDLLPGDRDIFHLTGSWSREMQVQRFAVPEGRFSFGSTKGTSSAQHPPFIALPNREANETHGEVVAAALVYSGNHEASVEKSEFGDVRLQMGLHPGLGEELAPGEEFAVPQSLLLHTAEGLGGMGRAWGAFVSAKLLPERPSEHRPVYLNTWESAYFDIDQDKTERLAKKAKELGCEMLVLDDGWFEGRRDDRTSLGDWRADKARFSRGIAELARRVNAAGLKFGLWFEPEMVSRNSDLFRAHPDWIIGAGEASPGEGRNQLTLDLSKPEVEAHVEKSVGDMLNAADIAYVKWDMNRVMSDVPAPALPHRYMLALYRIIRRLRERFPHVVFENCASGGNRFDYGMLSLFHQTWTSDLCDPEGRLSIQSGSAYFFPLKALASYIGPSPNHQNGRETSFQARRDVAFFCGSRGFSLSEADLERHEEEIKEAAALFASAQSLVLDGQFERLRDGTNEVVWQLTNKDRSELVVLYARKRSEANPPFTHTKLRGLDPGAEYVIRDGPTTFTGRSLMAAGLPLPHTDSSANCDGIQSLPSGDMATALIFLRRVKN
jgi:alpha-galactosidase